MEEITPVLSVIVALIAVSAERRPPVIVGVVFIPRPMVFGQAMALTLGFREMYLAHMLHMVVKSLKTFLTQITLPHEGIHWKIVLQLTMLLETLQVR